MLRHKGYIGEAHWGKSYAVVPENPYKEQKYKKQKKTSRKDRPEAEWYIIPIPVILDKDLFDRTRRQLEANFALAKRNRKNEFLLANKMWCTCGSRRCGCGPKSGRYLYYRCNDRIKQFPLPTQCVEGGLSAKVADKLVWQKIAGLMSSPELLLKQAEGWLNGQQSKLEGSSVDIKDLEKEIRKLKEQEERYNKAYGAGVFTLEQLKDYTVPLRERIEAVESQMAKAKEERNHSNSLGIPTKSEIEEFTKEASEVFKDLNFGLKREIVLNTIDKIVGNQKELKVYGNIPVSRVGNVLFCSKYRNRWFAERGEVHAF